MPTARQELATAIENYLNNALSILELNQKAVAAVFSATTGISSEEGKILETIIYFQENPTALRAQLLILGPSIGANI